MVGIPDDPFELRIGTFLRHRQDGAEAQRPALWRKEEVLRHNM